MPEALFQAVANVFLDPTIWVIVLLAAAYGVFVGSTPGLTATMATALLVPITYWMEPVPALAAVVTMVACAIFAGDIPTTLLRIPGTPASAAYADDVYGFTQRGQSGKALGVCLVGSVLGGLFGAIVLMTLGHQLVWITDWFTVPEYFWLYLLGLSCAILVSRASTLNATIGLLIGLLISTVGLSAVHTQARFTFDNPELFNGINFIPAMIGLFGISEVLKNILTLNEPVTPDSGINPKSETPDSSQEQNGETDTGESPAESSRYEKPERESSGGFVQEAILSVFGSAFSILLRRKIPFLRSGSIGTLVGMLPGAGADIAAWVSLAVSRKTKASEKLPEEEGLPEVADATTANSSALAGSWIPALVFGIPGDSVTAIVIGVLLMKNIKPGPEIFQSQASLVYSIYLIFILANLVLLPIGFLAIKAGIYIIRIPRNVLLPIILLFCVLGAYAINSSYFDVWVMLVMGLLGFFLERSRIPLGPVVLGIILGGPLEERFIQNVTAGQGNALAFFDRWPSAILGGTCIAIWVWLISRSFRKEPTQSDSSA